MSMVITDDGLELLLESEITYLNGLYIGLFKAISGSLTYATSMGDLTEVTDTGYTGTGRQHPAFVGTGPNASHQGQVTAPDLVWTLNHNAGNYDIIGWFASTASSGGTLVMAELFATAFTVTTPGQTFNLTPQKKQDTL